MSNNIIQAEYDRLENIAACFGESVENTTGMCSRIESGVQVLQNGKWEGQAANAFFTEMNRDVFPAITRLTNALEQAQSVTLQVKDIMQAAEEEAARPFGGEAGGTPIDGDGRGKDTIVSKNAPTSNLSSHDLVVKDPSQIFNEEYMEDMIGYHATGENSKRLNSLMEQLLKANQSGQGDISQVGGLLDEIAEIRGVDPDTFRQQYKTFQNLWSNAKNMGDIDLSKHGDFMGSTVSLRYGKVAGDVFGIDPVFGSILNPTGGLVGPGSNSYQPDSNDAIGYHGVFHDAGGYLYNYHEHIGPGYDYLNREPFPTGFAGTGQIGGISWWAGHPELNVDMLPHIMPDIPFVPDFIETAVANKIEDGVIRTIRQGAYIVEGGIDIADGVGDISQGNFTEGASDIMGGTSTIVTGTVRTGIEQVAGSGIVNSVSDLSSRIFGWPSK